MVQCSSHPPERFGHDRLYGVLPDLGDKTACDGIVLQFVDGLVQVEFTRCPKIGSSLAAFFEARGGFGLPRERGTPATAAFRSF
jgi:hypothetical protein